MNSNANLWTMNINILFLMSALMPTMLLQKNKLMAKETNSSHSDVTPKDEKNS